MKRYIKSDISDISDEDVDTRKEAAISSRSRISTLRRLSDDPSWEVREYLAHNKNLPEDLVIKLASDEAPVVREAIAEHPNLPRDLLLKFSDDFLPLIRLSVLYNPNVTKDIVEKALTDGDWRVEQMARSLIKKFTEE